MKRVLSLLMLAATAKAQSLNDADASARLSAPVTGAVSANGVLTATLTRRHCFGDLCLAPGVTVNATLTGKAVSVTQATSPEDFEVFGVSFAAHSTVTVSEGHVLAGTLARPIGIAGLQVLGEVVLRLGQKPRVLEGTLARSVTLHGWLVPEGFRLRGPAEAEWGAEPTEAAAPGAVMVRSAKGGEGPRRARAVSEGAEWRQLTLVEPWRVGEVVFGAGSWAVTFMPDGQRQVSGHLDSPLEAGVLRVERGAFVYWCDRAGLQEAEPGEVEVPGELFAIEGVAFTSQHLWVKRSGASVSGYKAETCTHGAISGYEIDLGQACHCGGAAAGGRATLKLDSRGRVQGTNRSFRLEVEEAKRPCDCAIPEGGPPPP
jgi:hypothetical protein